jgi:hypothetical protein
VDNAPCLTDFDCCDYYACTAGSCEPSCGQQDATCQVDSDCCSDQGLICYLFEQENTSICVPGAEDQPVTGSGANAQLVECGAHCSAYECQLGAACIPPAGDAPDPCAAAGLVCDLSNEVCRDPQLYESCIQGGPSCEPFPQSNVGNQCINLNGIGDGDAGLCLQRCSQTSDCADPLTSCYAGYSAELGGSFCDGTSCVTDFQPCESAAPGDGICEPEGTTSAGPQSLCQQESADGGTAGQACDLFNNRQRGGFCAFPNICNGGLCLPACNAGTGAVPGCAAGTNCLGVQGLTSDADDLGLCSVACDFTSPDGGGCAQAAGGPPEKCLPQLLLGLPDAPTGFCVAEVASPTAVGQDCGSEPNGLDGCSPGLLCLQASVAENSRCLQLCNVVSSSPGTGGCSASQVCTALNYGGGVEPTNTGFCD